MVGNGRGGIKDSAAKGWVIGHLDKLESGAAGGHQTHAPKIAHAPHAIATTGTDERRLKWHDRRR